VMRRNHGVEGSLAHHTIRHRIRPGVKCRPRPSATKVSRHSVLLKGLLLSYSLNSLCHSSVRIGRDSSDNRDLGLAISEKANEYD
jgi:hypothetical protein